MAIPHAKPAEVIDVRPLGAGLSSTHTATLIKTEALEVIRLVLTAGKEIKPHEVPGELTLQCLEGRVVVQTGHAQIELEAGRMAYLEGSTAHSVRAVEQSSLLVTILLVHKHPQ